MTRADEVQALVEETVAAHGRLDYMVNNAGIALAGEVRDLTLEHWRRVVDVNLWGVVHGVHAAYPVMVARRAGHIVNMASLAGLLPVPGFVPYATTKHAVVGLSTSLRAEAAGLGVKVTAVCPGFVATGIYDAATTVRVRMADLVKNLRTPPMDADVAAAAILRGVARNDAIVVVPRAARVLWRLHRAHRALTEPVMRRAIAGFRRSRTPDA